MFLKRVCLGQNLIFLFLALSCTYPQDDGPWFAEKSSLKLVRSVPTAGARNVSLRPTIKLEFSVPPKAEAIGANHIRLFSGLVETTGKFKVDILDKCIRFTPTKTLRPNLRYRMYLSGDIQAIDGSILGDSIWFEFTTGEQADVPVQPTPDKVLAREVQPIWTQQCKRCHNSMNTAGLNLSSTETSLQSLRGVQSNSMDLLRVQPLDHARSYLMRKLIGTIGIVGWPMPPTSDDNLTEEELRLVADWIDSGAQ
ncbi:MAG: Ig-like domain-containing protein [Pseudomonadota bacterium]